MIGLTGSNVGTLEQREILKNFHRYIFDRWAFLTECCYTIDEVNQEEKIKRIPAKSYLQHLVHRWETEQFLAIVKSRRMIVSWTLRALELHLALMTPYASVFVASADQTRSDKMIGRIKFIYDNLPPLFPKPEIRVHRGKSGEPTRLDFPELGSKIEGLSSEPDALRQEGATLVTLEEFAFWENPEESWGAILPTLQGGGKLVIVSSAKESLLRKIIFDETGSAVGM